MLDFTVDVNMLLCSDCTMCSSVSNSTTYQVLERGFEALSGLDQETASKVLNPFP